MRARKVYLPREWGQSFVLKTELSGDADELRAAAKALRAAGIKARMNNSMGVLIVDHPSPTTVLRITGKQP